MRLTRGAFLSEVYPFNLRTIFETMLDLKLTALVVFVFSVCLIVGWSRLENIEKSYNAKLADLSRLKSLDSTLQAKHNDSLRQVIYERRNKL